MTPQLRNDLIRISRAFQLLDDDSFSFADGPVFDASERIQFYPSDVELVDEPILIVMRRVIYFQCFVRPFEGRLATPDPDASTDVSPEQLQQFVDQLAEANRGLMRWDPFWRVYRVGLNGELHVQKGDTHYFAIPGEYSFAAGPGLRPQNGDFVNLQVLTESFSFQDNYYFCFGEEIGDEFEDFSKVRFYFNVAAEKAAELVEFVTSQLNDFQVPFRFKCPKDPDNYDRLDTAVLYVAARWFQITAQIIGQFAAPELGNLQAGVPLFCRELWPGIGFAEDPEGSESFGETRCDLVAKGIRLAWRSGSDSQNSEGQNRSDQDELVAEHGRTQPTDAELIDAIESVFREAGIGLNNPWLNAGTVNDYEVPAMLIDSQPGVGP
jgi:hypothetical protein